jgi:hypothetical protein
MAEHLNQDKSHEPAYEDGMNNMGKPIPDYRREEAYRQCKEMGLDSADAMACVSETAEQLERDKPYEAQGRAMKYIDLTGAYRIFAVLLIHQERKILQ